jgi:two-component system, cell cycle response regulator
MKLISTKQVAVRIAIIISSAELLIMLLLRVLPYEAGTYSEAVLDTVFLTVVSIPAIYIWVIKPFVDARDEVLAQISHLAMTDPVTQLANRRLISDHLSNMIASCVRHRDHGAVLLIDLDGFKDVNDLYGHEAGDAVLVEIANRLKSIVRSEDVVGRLGGDEFIILLQHLGAEETTVRESLLRLAEKLISKVSVPFAYNTKTIHVGASIGIRLLGFEQLDSETAIGEADRAMYRAKAAGRGRAVFFKK